MSKVKLIDKIADDAFKSEYFNVLYRELIVIYGKFKIEGVQKFDARNVSDLCRFADIFSISNKEVFRVLAYQIISRLYHVAKDNETLLRTARAVFIKLGLFVTEEKFIDSTIKLPVEKELLSLFKKDKQKNPFGSEYFTDSQFNLLSKIKNEKSFSFSGPTSFGKSFLIKNIMCESALKGKNTVVLVPSKALIEEYLKDIRRKFDELGITTCNIVKTASLFDDEKVNVMILTPERLNALIYNDKEIKIDVLIVDEAQKLGNDDERAITAFKVIRKTLDLNPSMTILFSSPVISNPSVFLKTFNLDETKFRVVKESPVTQNLFFVNLCENEISLYDEVNKVFSELPLEVRFDDRFDFIRSLSKQDDSNLIYCQSKLQSVQDAVRFCCDMELKSDPELHKSANFIRELVHEDYYLADLVEKGVAYHNSDLPKFIRDIVEELYQKKLINYVFCTSTLLEGVNLPTGNLFISSIKASKKVTNSSKLSFWNLAGRAGRYTKELDGNIFCIKEEPEHWKTISDLTNSKESVLADSTALKKLERGQKLLNVLENGKLDEGKQERMMEQMVNIILSEFMGNKASESPSSVFSSIPVKFHRRLLKKLEEKFATYNLGEVPVNIIASGHNIPLDKHLSVTESIKSNPLILKGIANSDIYKSVVTLCDVYSLKYTEPQISRLYIIAQAWISGQPLKLIIKNTIDYYVEKGNSVRIDYGEYEEFDIKRKNHVNIVINEIISTIENDITYKLELYANHYHLNLINHYTEDSAGLNLATYLEAGTRDKFEMALQNYGFSRAASSDLIKNHKYVFKFDSENQVSNFNKEQALKNIDKNSLTYREVMKF